VIPYQSAASAPWYRRLLEWHLVRFAEGHDPLGHLLAIERLARAARAELTAVRSPVQRIR
jgi:hypothetical protein